RPCPLVVLELRIARRHHSPRFARDEVDAAECDADPGIDHDALVQYPVENVDEARAAASPFYWHRSVSLPVGIATVASCVATTRRERRDLALEQPHLAAQLLVLGGQTIAVRGQVSVILPPIETDLLRLVDGAHDESNADRD